MREMTWLRGSALMVALVWIVTAGAGAARATTLFTGTPEATFTDEAAAPWALVERHRDPHPRWLYEPHHPHGNQLYPPVVAQFGTATPESQVFLLHAAPGWDTARRANPVLCLPGAFDDATRRYCRPLPMKHPDHLKVKGLALYLAEQGYAAFGLTFAHYQGCNLHQGEQVADAIARIRALLRRQDDPTFQVDLVTYSKGIFAARCYLEDAPQFYDMKHLTAYRGDVRRCVFQGGPIAGMDSPYRYYAYPLLAEGKTDFPPMPQPAEGVLKYGVWRKPGPDDSIFSDCWVGTRQCMYDLRKLGISYCPLSYTPDMNLSMLALADGGRTFLLESRGLDAAVEAGGRLVERLNQRGLPPGVGFALVTGSHPVLYRPETILGFQIPLGAELSATSDGAVFLKSALFVQGLTARGAASLGTQTWKLNHLQLSASTDVHAWIASKLAAADEGR